MIIFVIPIKAAEDTTTPATTTEEAAATVNINDTQVSESDQTISAIDELLNQVRQQAAEEYNKGKQSKSDAEVPIGQMIATLKRIICGRYKKWQLVSTTENIICIIFTGFLFIFFQ